MQSYKDIINYDNKKKKDILKKTCILYSVYKMGQYDAIRWNDIDSWFLDANILGYRKICTGY